MTFLSFVLHTNETFLCSKYRFSFHLSNVVACSNRKSLSHSIPHSLLSNDNNNSRGGHKEMEFFFYFACFNDKNRMSYSLKWNLDHFSVFECDKFLLIKKIKKKFSTHDWPEPKNIVTAFVVRDERNTTFHLVLFPRSTRNGKSHSQRSLSIQMNEDLQRLQFRSFFYKKINSIKSIHFVHYTT